MLNDMRIQIAPSGAIADRVNLLADDIELTPAPGKRGQLREYVRKNDPTKPGDAFVAAQAKATKARLSTLDADFIKRAPQFGVKLAEECSSIKGVSGPEDPIRGRQLLGLNPKPIGSNGEVSLHAPTISGVAGAYVVTSGTGGASEGTGQGGGGSTTTAYVSVPDNTLPSVGGPSARGQAVIGGIQLALEGINFTLNLINDHIQKQKVDDALDRIRPTIAKERGENPQKGVLLLFYYTQFQPPEERIIKPGAEFHYVIWGNGPTRDEAREDALSTPSISAGTGLNTLRFSQEVWLPPLKVRVNISSRIPSGPA
jgi:hypothetical protein